MTHSSGTITFQANDNSDIFYKTEVMTDQIEESDEALMGIEDLQFASEVAAITGNGPKMKPVLIPGDTTVIHVWYQSRILVAPFAITVYIEYEEAEELIDSREESEESATNDTDMESNEIHL
jgi:hypothetical protein